jgi:cytolysin (calcineurin-like family phosphatase)
MQRSTVVFLPTKLPANYEQLIHHFGYNYGLLRAFNATYGSGGLDRVKERRCA